MFAQSGLLLLGIAMLLGGGELLVRGASALAIRFKVSPTVVGLTVVAFCTSAPELVVCLLAAHREEAALAFGNVFGSNLANAGLLVGLTAVLAPLRVESQIIKRELPLLALTALIAIAMGADGLFGGEVEGFARGDGLVLLALFALFLLLVLGWRSRQDGQGALEQEVCGAPWLNSASSSMRILAALLLGLALLTAGGELVVGSATFIARAAGVPEVVVGLTLVSIGTSLPELVTCLLSARKGLPGLALGNVVGSNFFNLLMVMGATATYRAVPLPAGGRVDLLANLGVSLALLALAREGRDISRKEGLLLLLLYSSYLASLAWR